MAVVIADAGPLIALSKIDQLVLLQNLFNEVSITEAVCAECIANDVVDSQRIRQGIQKGWIKIVANPELIHVRSRSLGLGEKTSIEFAAQTHEPVLLILDDALARKKAKALNVPVIGTAMLIYKAEQKHYLENADALMQALIKNGYRIHESVIQSVKEQLKK